MSLPPKENALFKRILVSGGAGGPGWAAGSALRRPQLGAGAGGERSPGATAPRSRGRPGPAPPAPRCSSRPGRAAPGPPLAHSSRAGRGEAARAPRNAPRPLHSSLALAAQPPTLARFAFCCFASFIFFFITHSFAVDNYRVCWEDGFRRRKGRRMKVVKSCRSLICSQLLWKFVSRFCWVAAGEWMRERSVEFRQRAWLSEWG